MAILITEALEIIDHNITAVSEEVIPIELALGRILAEDHVATFDLPRFDNSSRDGFAVKCADAGKMVMTTQVIYAGDKPEMVLQEKSAIRIMTGAPIPQGCEAIVQFEDVTEHHNKVTLPETIKPNMYIRPAGEDMKKGSIYLHKGLKITAYGITLLVSQGITHVKVYRKIKVSVFSSGNELRSHYENIEGHQIYNSNTPMFLSRSQSLDCEVSHVHNIEDALPALEKAIKTSLTADIIITTGGMNFGDKDFTQEAFANCGMALLFNRVEIKPGRPIAFGKIGNTAIVNLPGNPLAAMVNFEIFIRPIIHKMSGNRQYHPATINTTLQEDFQLKKGGYTVTLGRFDGKSFIPLKQQMAGLVSPLQDADAMIITPPDIREIKKGDTVKILPISWEFFSPEKEDFYST